ncbi:MarR family transcriptional regulator [Glycomyces sp. L485]|uniref:MarR family winged helix-turn-helix transcriptional regulator n=1 Tax=Glycomyces sp. L485 TaxID=2909235 RepID=UPI001F4B3645|nr:MarR family transcriptional regulator [Glycomyces sp. L485]MCH7232825.1 MarR family transcriptional regulator [Glycomyces sp. L485]
MSDDGPWLDDEEMEAWMALVGVFTKLPAALDEQLRRDARLSHFEYGVLAALEQSEGHTNRMSDLAFLCNGSLSRLSHVARRLEDAGLIERFPSPTDGRATLARITEQGVHRLAKAAPGHVELVRRLVFDELDGQEIARLRTLSRRIVDRIEESSQ